MSADHGNTPAAWTAVTIIFAGFVVGGFAVALGSVPFTGVGAAIIVAGAVVGKVMQMMGMGSKSYTTAGD